MLDKIDIFMYLETLFNKPFSEITKEEFQTVTIITLDYDDTTDKNNQIGLLQILEMLPNLKEITIKNKLISQELLNELSRLKVESLSLDKCSINNDVTLNIFPVLKELSLSNCALLDYSILDTINPQIVKIAIINPVDEKIIDITHFMNYLDLKELYMEKCIVQNISKINTLKNLRVLSLLWSEIEDIDKINVLLNMKNLVEIYLSEDYHDLNDVKNLSRTKKIYYNLNHLVLEKD